MFFTYHQNNSGGSFYNDNMVAKNVIIEADTADRANTIAEHIGIYFDGVASGDDCSCCGDRWYEVGDTDGTTIPMIYGAVIENHRSSFVVPGQIRCYVYYRSGVKRLVY